MKEGWIALHRRLLDWEWFTDHPVLVVFLFCLLRANHKPSQWRGIDIQRGELITSHETIANSTGLTVQRVRTAISKLKSTNEVTTKPTNKFTVISITNFEKYQDSNRQDNEQLTINQQSTNIQSTTDNNDNNINNKNKDYAFDGAVVKLNQADYERFKANCPGLSDPQYRKALTNADLAYKLGDSKNWYFRLANYLKAENKNVKTPVKPQASEVMNGF